MADLTQKLPAELLAEILGHVPVLDVLRFKQVNRVFRDAILASPFIRHKIDLFAAGLEYNAAAGIGLAESQKAFLQYRSNLDSLRPIEERTVDNLGPDTGKSRARGGVYAIVKESVRLFSLGSASRRIPYKEWEIPLPGIHPRSYDFYPGADVIAFLEAPGASDLPIRIHLRTLSDGGYHPTAQCPAIHYSRRGAGMCPVWSMSITSSRLVVLMNKLRGNCVVIWDWKSAEVLFELEEERCSVAVFMDDYRLLVHLESSHAPPSIMLMDTGKNVGGTPLQTFFHLSPYFDNSGWPYFLLEQGAHKPSPAEDLAPFHQDFNQRIVALVVPQAGGYPFIRVGALLELLEGHEGGEIGWDEWKSHLIMPSIDLSNQRDLVDIWVSGCRLFTITSANDGLDVLMEVYDSSMQGRPKYLSERVNANLDGARYLLPTGARARLPWEAYRLGDAYSGHDSVALLYTLDASTEGEPEEDECVLHVWTF